MTPTGRATTNRASFVCGLAFIRIATTVQTDVAAAAETYHASTYCAVYSAN